jgi:hypothetical protein
MDGTDGWTDRQADRHENGHLYNNNHILATTLKKKKREREREEKIINREGKRSFHLLTEINRIKRMSSFWLGFTYDRVVPIPPSCVLQFFIISQTHPKNILFNHNQNWGVGNTKRRRKKTQSRWLANRLDGPQKFIHLWTVPLVVYTLLV